MSQKIISYRKLGNNLFDMITWIKEGLNSNSGILKRSEPTSIILIHSFPTKIINIIYNDLPKWIAQILVKD